MALPVLLSRLVLLLAEDASARCSKDIVLDVARGLSYLHSQRIAHLDIKSGNVLLTRQVCCSCGWLKHLQHASYPGRV